MTGHKVSAPPWDRVILTGFRGTGKSAVGRRIARRTGFIFIDTDDTLEEELGCTVCTYVEQAGWPAFREKERLLLDRLAGVHRAVIATGGGAIIHRTEWRKLRKNSRVIWLRAAVETIRRRLEEDCDTATQRPTLTGRGALTEIDAVLAEREPLYLEGSDVSIDTDGRSADEIVARICELLSD